MKSGNYLDTRNSQKARLDGRRPIYRMMPLCYLLELFEKKQNVLVKPHKWKDPFENCIIETENVYGQCWTFKKASDALWKIYSGDSVAIRVRSRVGTLKKTLETAIVGSGTPSVFVEEVRYLTETQTREFASELHGEARPFSNRIVASGLVIKKRAFAYEHELRLLFFRSGPEGAINDLFRYSVDPLELIEQIMIDPQISKPCGSLLKKYIHQETGFPADKIRHSRIYNPPSGTRQYSQKGEPVKTRSPKRDSGAARD